MGRFADWEIRVSGQKGRNLEVHVQPLAKSLPIAELFFSSCVKMSCAALIDSVGKFCRYFLSGNTISPREHKMTASSDEVMTSEPKTLKPKP